jgi:diguanylate cyclase (GGDEF)-like protein
MQYSSRFGKSLFFWALLTFFVIIAHNILPAKKWHWIPAENLYYFVYADDMFGGASYAERVDPYAIHLRCMLLPTDTDLEPFCGFHVYLDRTKNPPAVDLSGYNKVYVDLEYSGNNRKLRVYIRDFEQGYSDPKDPIETAKYMSTYVLAESDLNNLVIDMREFTVADWWVNNHDVPREHALPGLENVVAFGVDVAYPAALGEHELKLNKVTFVGDWVSTENWYLGILLCWIAGFFIAGIVKLYEFRHLVAAEKAKLARLEKEKEKYQELSMVDQLTGLLNRHGLSSFFENEISRGNRPASLLLIDIDHFKTVNDTYGHSVGDIILRRIAEVISDHSRQLDKAGRWGGEEFLMLLPQTTLIDAVKLAERLRISIMTLEHPEAAQRPVTVSIGVAEVREDEAFSAAFDRADAALYKAKDEGRNRVVRESR